MVRHAESRYNAAVRTLSLSAMVGERDHGLSKAGQEQCAALRQRLEAAARQGDEDACAILNAEAWLSSPLKRALATAALVGGTSLLVALPEGREHCFGPLFARDSEGTPRDAIARCLSAELGAECHVDVSKIADERWWSVAETSGSVRRRVGELLRELYCRCEHRPAVFVGHSRVLRDMFKDFSSSTRFRSSCPTCPLLGDRLVANCAVLKVCLVVGNNDEEDDCGARILSAEFLFGTGFR